MDQSSPPEFQAEWITRIQGMDSPEGLTLRRRLLSHIRRFNDENGSPFARIEYRLPILRLITTGIGHPSNLPR